MTVKLILILVGVVGLIGGLFDRTEQQGSMILGSAVCLALGLFLFYRDITRQ